MNNRDWAQSCTQILEVTSNDLAIMKGDVVAIKTDGLKESDLLMPHGVNFTAPKYEHVILVPDNIHVVWLM